MSDLNKLSQQLNEAEYQLLSQIAELLLENNRLKWTGRLSFEVNFSKGGLNQVFIDTKELFFNRKTRKMRGGGI